MLSLSDLAKTTVPEPETPLAAADVRKALALTPSDIRDIIGLSRDPTCPIALRAKLYAMRLAQTVPALPQTIDVQGGGLEALVLGSLAKGHDSAPNTKSEPQTTKPREKPLA